MYTSIMEFVSIKAKCCKIMLLRACYFLNVEMLILKFDDTRPFYILVKPSFQPVFYCLLPLRY